MIKLSKKFYLFFALVSALLVLTSCATILNGYKISLDDSEYQIRLGQSLEINPTVTQNNEPCEVKLVFHSYNEEVVSFEGNVLTAKKAGTAKIKVAIAEDTKVYDTAIVTVVDDASLEAEFVYEKHMIKGKTQEITYHFVNGDDTRVLDFVSQNEDVIQVVNHNQLKAVGKGIAIVETRVYSTFDERIYLDYEFEITVDYQDYTIEYDFSGGVEDEHLNPMTYNEGSDFVLNNPTREYYKFDGWYNGEVKVERLAGDQTGDLTLKAHWIPEEYHINYVYEGGHEGTANPTTYNVESDFTLNSPVRDDYEFVGWFSGDTKVEKLANGLHGDLTLVARWAAKSYHITYDFAKGTEDPALNPTTYSVESDFTLKAPTREHYEFVGWFNGDVKVEHLAGDQTGDLTLTAHWEATKYSVTYEFAGGTVDNNLNPATYTVEDNFTLKAPTRAGYDFTGWYDEKGTKVEHLGGDVTGNLKLTAQYDEIFNKISDVLDASFTGTAKVRGIVVAVYNEGLLLKDETGYILAYKASTEPNFAKGDFVKIEGTKGNYNNSTRFEYTEITALDSEIEGLELPNDSSLVKATAENVDNAYDNSSYNESYFEFILKLSSTGTYVNAPLEGAKVTISLKLSKANSAGLSTAFGKYYRVKGYYINNSVPSYFNVIVAEITELTAQEKVDITFDNLGEISLPEFYKDGETFIEPEVSSPFEDVKFKWEVIPSELLVEDIWVITEDGKATIKLTITCETATKEKNFDVNVKCISGQEKIDAVMEQLNSMLIPDQFNGDPLNIPTFNLIEGVSVDWSADNLIDGKWSVTRNVTTTLKATVSFEGADSKSKEFTNVNVYAFFRYEFAEVGEYSLVTDVNDLEIGAKIIIVAKDSNKAMGALKTNNFSEVDIVKDGNIIRDVTDVTIIILEKGLKDGQFALKVGDKYLYAASSGSNHLKEEDTLTVNSSWTISINGGVTSIIATDSSNRNILRYNSNSNLFSCYASGQDEVQIFKCSKIKVGIDEETYANQLWEQLENIIQKEVKDELTLDDLDGKITWTMDETYEIYALLEDNYLVVDQQEEDTIIKLVAHFLEFTKEFEITILAKEKDMTDEQINAILDSILEEITDTIPAEEDSIALPSSDSHISYSIASGDAGKVSGNTLTVKHPNGSSDAEITLRVTYEINEKSLYKDKIIKIVAVQAVEKTYKHTFVSGDFKVSSNTTNGGTADLSGINWTYTAVKTYFAFNGTDGYQIGKKNTAGGNFTLTTSDIKGKIKKIIINGRLQSGSDAAIEVTVNGSIVGSRTKFKGTSLVDHAFELGTPTAGEIKIAFISSAAYAYFIKSITVVYEETL